MYIYIYRLFAIKVEILYKNNLQLASNYHFNIKLTFFCVYCKFILKFFIIIFFFLDL